MPTIAIRTKKVHLQLGDDARCGTKASPSNDYGVNVTTPERFVLLERAECCSRCHKIAVDEGIFLRARAGRINANVDLLRALSAK